MKDGKAGKEKMSVAAEACSRQAAYLSRADVLLRYSSDDAACGGSSGGGSGEEDAGDAMVSPLGGLEALAILWGFVGRSYASCFTKSDGGEGSTGSDTRACLFGATTAAAAYTAGLRDMGVCARAAFGFWAAAKLLLMLQVREQKKVLLFEIYNG